MVQLFVGLSVYKCTFKCGSAWQERQKNKSSKCLCSTFQLPKPLRIMAAHSLSLRSAFVCNVHHQNTQHFACNAVSKTTPAHAVTIHRRSANYHPPLWDHQYLLSLENVYLVHFLNIYALKRICRVYYDNYTMLSWYIERSWNRRES